MKITKYALVFLLSVGTMLSAQAQSQDEEKTKVIAVIKQMFDGMRKSDAKMVGDVFYEGATLHSAFISRKTGKPMLHGEKTDKFVESIKNKKPEDKYDERISEYVVKIDDNLANVWTPYKFYLNDKFSHCGVNNFQLFKSEQGWKIISIVDTRRRDKCE